MHAGLPPWGPSGGHHRPVPGLSILLSTNSMHACRVSVVSTIINLLKDITLSAEPCMHAGLPPWGPSGGHHRPVQGQSSPPCSLELAPPRSCVPHAPACCSQQPACMHADLPPWGPSGGHHRPGPGLSILLCYTSLHQQKACMQGLGSEAHHQPTSRASPLQLSLACMQGYHRGGPSGGHHRAVYAHLASLLS